MGLVARLYRMVPLIIILIVVALIIYGVVSFRRSPLRAKEVLIKIFTVLTLIISGFFAIVTLYGLFEGNTAVVDLFGSFLIVSLIAFGITRWCRFLFVRHHPSFKVKRTTKARVVRRWPWRRRRQP